LPAAARRLIEMNEPTIKIVDNDKELYVWCNNDFKVMAMKGKCKAKDFRR